MELDMVEQIVHEVASGYPELSEVHWANHINEDHILMVTADWADEDGERRAVQGTYNTIDPDIKPVRAFITDLCDEVLEEMDA